jgi:hypothetical protein
MTLGANILPVFEQLGLMDEMEQMSLPYKSIEFFNTNLKTVGSIDISKQKAM